MTARLLIGKEIAAHVLDHVSERARRLSGAGIKPQLVFVLIGESEPAAVYVRRLEKLGSSVGVAVARHHLPATAGHADLQREISTLNADPAVDGILIQMPLPGQLSAADLSPVIDPHKDVDGITIQNAGRLYLGLTGQRPSTAAALLQILDWAGINPAGMHAVVVGRSPVVGHPVAEMLLARNASVTITHRHTRDLAHFTRDADLLAVAAGAPGLVKPDMVKPGAVILDAGINVGTAGITGDVDPECAEVASAMTPVPGGVGPVTNAVLIRAVVQSAEQRAG